MMMIPYFLLFLIILIVSSILINLILSKRIPKTKDLLKFRTDKIQSDLLNKTRKELGKDTIYSFSVNTTDVDEEVSLYWAKKFQSKWEKNGWVVEITEKDSKNNSSIIIHHPYQTLKLLEDNRFKELESEKCEICGGYHGDEY